MDVEYRDFYKRKRVLITGHTGFKGSWLTLLLHSLGADVYGYALEPPTDPSLFVEARLEEIITSYIADVRDHAMLLDFIQAIKPEIIIHMAAQPLVRESYKDPVKTYSTNVMGTVNLLEAVRQVKGVKVVVNVTSDKCYENREWHWGYREDDALGGYDPYSNSKACSELVTAAYRTSFFNKKQFNKHGVALSSARAGNVIGGGDWAEDRLFADFARAITIGKKLKIRNPHAIRPWQHVMEPLTGYLLLAHKLYVEGPKFAGAWNFGPCDSDAKNVEWITKTICELWGNDISYEIESNPQPHEASYLKLDCSRARAELGWVPKWDIRETLFSIVEWNKAWLNGSDLRKITMLQIEEYLSCS